MKSHESVQLRDDNTSVSIFVKQFDSINLFFIDRYLTFSYNISVFNDLMTDKFNLIKLCRSQNALTKILLERLHLLKNAENNTKNIPLQFDTIIPMQSDFIDILPLIKNKNKCKFKNLNNIIKKITNLTSEIDKIMHNDYSSINNLVSKSLIELNIKKIINSYKTKNISLHSHNVSLRDLHGNVRYNLAIRGNKMLITYKIPLYEKNVLNMIFPKPILFNDIPFILRTKSQFAIFDSKKPIVFNENTIDDNCSDYNGSKFCDLSNITNTCDSRFVNLNNITELSLDCFKKLPESHIVTQFSRNVYYTIPNPITINLICNNKTIKYALNNSKVLENFSDCVPDKSSVDYEMHPTEIYYKMHFIRAISQNNASNVIHYTYNKQSFQWNSILILILIILIFTLIILFIIIIFFKCKPNIKPLNDKIYFYVPTSSIDTEV